ncbi:ABC transporter substrate-binding protein [Motilimonas cestriensis]|uniref:ABC transporter substrate-binding protein n=1 Tax=Motilimonas cestriensis TaxID=2742685 RepID=A0ABS8WAE4_9GAMM|nr:ABC transporter substrate-binding protein [Motilimonas cestriensis]MCE2595450.1 ABC transporter substrate-binding protein [Motilimonas cestriensis]
MSKAMTFSSRLLSFAILTGLISACVPQNELLRVGAAPWPGFEPIFLAREMEYLDTQLVSLYELTSASHVAHSFEAGKLDVAFLSLDEVLTLITRGSKLKVIAIVDESVGGDAIIGLPGVTQIKHLKGKRIGYENNAAGSLLLAEALSHANLVAHDVELIEVKLDEQRQVFHRNQVDALITSEPVKQKLLALGGVPIFDSARLPGRIVNLIVASDNAILHQQPALIELLKSYYKARKFQKGRPQKAVQLMAMRLQLYTSEMHSSLQGVKFIEPVESILRLSGQAKSALNTQAQDLGELMVYRGMLEQVPDLSQLVNSQVLEKVIYE